MRIGILLDRAGGEPVNIASVYDASAVSLFAMFAVHEAKQRANNEPDNQLRVVRELDAERLESTLRRLIPDMPASPTLAAVH